MAEHLLPNNATPLEKALSLATSNDDLKGPIGAIRGTKYTSPMPSMLPFLVYEYGLGELTPYVPNLYNLIREGVQWERIRGSLKSLAMALGWIGYSGKFQAESVRRIYWNLFQIELDRVRDSRADLDRIDGVVSLSVPLRSVFWRGFKGHDIRPMAYGEKSWSEAHYGEYSGVRLRAGSPLWSFGRSHVVEHAMSRHDVEAAGVEWIDPVAGELGWDDVAWDETEASWESDAARTRAVAISQHFAARRAWVRFDDRQGNTIGYRRVRAWHFVTPVAKGLYRTNAEYSPTESVEPLIYAEALTGFGDGAGLAVASVSLVLDGVPTDTARPGKLWLGPDEFTGGSVPICTTWLDIALGESIRERVKFLLRF